MAAQSDTVLRHIDHLFSRAKIESTGDAVLLDRFVSRRDESAFAALVARHGPMVLGVCRRILGDLHQAEDAFQATFLVLARKADSLRRPETLAAWLYGTARRLALKHRRQDYQRRKREIERIRSAPTSRVADPLDELTGRELLLAIDEELARLPENYRLPLILCALEGRTREEAARLLGWTTASLRGRLERARALLRARLTRRGLMLGAMLPAVLLSPSSVSTSLVDATVRAARAFALGIREGIAAEAMTLAKSAIADTMATKAKIGVLLLAMAFVAGTGALSYSESPSRERERAVAAAEPLAHVRGSDSPRTDRYGDPLPDGALARLGTLRFRQGFLTRQVAFSPDGKIIACAGNGRGVCLWDVATGKMLRQINRTNQGNNIAVSPDGKVLACVFNAVDGGPALYEMATGRKIADLPSNVISLAYAPDGKTIAGVIGPGKAIHFFDAATGKKQTKEIDGGQDGVNRLAWSPNGKRLAWVSGRSIIHLWDTAKGEEIAQWKDREKTFVFDAAFSPDSQTLATAGMDGTIHLWDVATHQKPRILDGKHDFVRTVLFSRDGRMLASGYRDGTIVLWDVVKGEEIRSWHAHAFGVSSVDFSPDGKTLVSGAHWECGPRLWDVATGEEVRPFAGHTSLVERVTFSTDGSHLFSFGREKQIRNWDLTGGRERLHFRLPEHPPIMSPYHWALSPRGDVAAIWNHKDGAVHLWDTARQKELRTVDRGEIPKKKEAVIAAVMSFSPDGRRLAIARGDSVSLRDAATGVVLRQFKGLSADIECLEFSSDGKRLAAGSGSPGGGSLAVWDTETGKRVAAVSNIQRIDNIAFSPGGHMLASGSFQEPVRLWDAATGQELRRLDSAVEIYGAAFSPDGKWLAGAGTEKDQKVHIWEVNTGLKVRSFRGHFSCVSSVAFAPDGRTIASGGGGSTILLWDFTGRRKNGRRQTVTWTPAESERRWSDLASKQGSQAVQAIWDLAASPRQAVSMIRQRIEPVKPADARRVEQLIRDLDSEEFETRKKATQELEKIVERAEPILRKKLVEKPSLEARQRIRNLLSAALPGKLVRELRAVQVLEYAGTDEAREELRRLAGGMAEAQLTRDAKAALERLTKK